jgi:hypothetical protein
MVQSTERRKRASNLKVGVIFSCEYAVSNKWRETTSVSSLHDSAKRSWIEPALLEKARSNASHSLDRPRRFVQ